MVGEGALGFPFGLTEDDGRLLVALIRSRKNFLVSKPFSFLALTSIATRVSKMLPQHLLNLERYWVFSTVT